MDLGLQGKVALVAGASRGLGRAIALEFARERAKVAICARGKDALEKTAGEIRAVGGEVLAIVADVGRPEDCDRVVAEALRRFGTVHVLINNAGGPPAKQFVETTEEEWAAAVNMNLMSAVRMSRAVIPHMRQQKWGRIINITSMTVKQPVANLILSNSVRLAVVGLAKTMASEVARDNILVNNVCPGPIATDRLESLTRQAAERQGISYEEALRRLWTNDVPLGRVGQPEEFAAVVVFLASERASFVTGTTLQIDGGAVKASM